MLDYTNLIELGLAGIGSPFIVELARRINPAKMHKFLRDHLTGSWSGMGFVLEDQLPLKATRKFDVECDFEAGRHGVGGTLTFTSPTTGKKVVDEFDGKYLGGRVFSVNYDKRKNHDGIVGRGTIYFEFDADVSILRGRICGLASHTGHIFASRVTLTKHPLGSKFPVPELEKGVEYDLADTPDEAVNQ